MKRSEHKSCEELFLVNATLKSATRSHIDEFIHLQPTGGIAIQGNFHVPVTAALAELNEHLVAIQD